MQLIKDDKLVVSCSADKSVAITDIATRKVLKKFEKMHSSNQIIAAFTDYAILVVSTSNCYQIGGHVK